MERAFVVHGHFYQPPRENPWTEEVGLEASAAPAHDWNERITDESYRPNGVARIVDDLGRIEGIVNNFEYLSYNMGPTLLSWLEGHAPDAYRRIVDADQVGGGALAQAFSHLILPLASERDIRTQIRWGLADFARRFGRPATGMWLPETAVDDTVLRVLVEEGVAFTILAPGQAAPDEQPIDTTVPRRWDHPGGQGSIVLVFYDGGLSHDAAFGLSTMTSQGLIDRVEARLASHTPPAGGDQDGGPAGFTGAVVTLAADGETFGHHHRWGDRLLAYALAVEAPRRGLAVSNLNRIVAALDVAALQPVSVVPSAWSCAHGIGRWREDCGCSTGGQPGWDQRWRAPLRAALDHLRDVGVEVFERRGGEVFKDPWAARDAYVDVVLDAVDLDDFVAAHVTGDRIEALTLLEAQRHAMSMYTSCGWFFNDLAGLETVQILRYAARVIDLMVEVGEPSPEAAFLDILAAARSNDPAEGDGRRIWGRHVLTARVDPDRAVAHLALIELLDGRPPGAGVAAYDVEVFSHDASNRGTVSLCGAHVALTHRRTGRRTERVWAALRLGGLEVLGACRPPDPQRDGPAATKLWEAFASGAPVTTLLRLVSDGFGPHEFGLESTLPDAAGELLQKAADTLADRFAAAYERLFDDHRDTLAALAAAGFHMPAELRAPGELALSRRLEQELARQQGSLDPADYAQAIAVAAEARRAGLSIDTPSARATVGRLLLRATRFAVDQREPAAVDAALAVLRISTDLGLQLDLTRPQELAYAALQAGHGVAGLDRLGAALGLNIERY